MRSQTKFKQTEIEITSNKEVLEFIKEQLENKKIKSELKQKIAFRDNKNKDLLNFLTGNWFLDLIMNGIIYDLLKRIIKSALNKFTNKQIKIIFNNKQIEINSKKDIEKLKIEFDEKNLKVNVKFKQTEIGLIPEDWEVKKIGDFGKVVTGKTPPSKNPEYFGEGIPFVTPTDFSNYNKHIYSASRSVSKEGQNRFKNLILKKDSIIVTCIGSDMGKVALNKVECITNQQINSITNINNAKPNFVYYKLKSIYSLLKSMATSGSTMPIVNKSDFQNILLSVPKNLDEQYAIAKILSDLDSKIELLQKQNETLEKIGQAIFKHWFVDFEFPNEEGDPYKSSGGEMVDSELGEIPKGWSVGVLKDILSLEYGKGLPKIKHVGSKYPVYGSGGISGYNDEFIVKGPGIIVGRAGCPGRIHLIQYNFWPVDSTLFVNCKEKVFFYVLNLLKKMKLEHLNSGSAVPGLNRNTAYSQKIIIPNSNYLEEYNDLMGIMYNKFWINEREILSLQKTRDLLLPKLMTGKIRVPLEVEE